MIPCGWLYPVSCDKCGAHKNLYIENEKLDSLSIDIALTEAAEAEGWAVLYPQTFCPECVRAALNHALMELANEISIKQIREPAPRAEAQPGPTVEGAA